MTHGHRLGIGLVRDRLETIKNVKRYSKRIHLFNLHCLFQRGVILLFAVEMEKKCGKMVDAGHPPLFLAIFLFLIILVFDSAMTHHQK